MKKQKMLCVIFLIALIISLVKHSKAMPEIIPEINLRTRVEYKAENLKDPFAPVKMKEEVKQQAQVEKKEQVALPLPPPKLEIQGVVWGGYFPQAIINKKVVKIGDLIEGARITEINKNGVCILFDNQQYNLASPGIINNAESFSKKQK